MNYKDVAAGVLAAIGGSDNVERAMTCLTRLRLALRNRSLADLDELRGLRGVLGAVPHGAEGVEVVFGPASIEGVAREFAIQSGIVLDEPGGTCANPLAGITGEAGDEQPTEPDEPPFIITAGHRRSYRAQQQAAIDEERLGKEDIEALRAFLDEEPEPSKGGSKPAPETEGKSVLVINGPNINLLGTREPNLYGRADYSALVRTCKVAAKEAGFADIHCFQSNHEGSIVDEIQGALGVYDGIVINPAAYTHTSIAILDAVKAVSLPCVEVHISKVAEREDFRQVSYIRAACFETITGMGLEGYRKAIFDLAKHLGI